MMLSSTRRGTPSRAPTRSTTESNTCAVRHGLTSANIQVTRKGSMKSSLAVPAVRSAQSDPQHVGYPLKSSYACCLRFKIADVVPVDSTSEGAMITSQPQVYRRLHCRASDCTNRQRLLTAWFRSTDLCLLLCQCAGLISAAGAVCVQVLQQSLYDRFPRLGLLT